MPDVMKTVGRYEILRDIGRGGMAIVYLARQTDLDRSVALKELGAFHASDPSFAQRFLRESRVAGSLSHPNIVTVHDYFEHEGTPYIAMEYIERGSLRPYVGHMTPAQIGGVLEGVLAGLAHAEEHGIVHRDLKPENLMVTAEGRVKIADFGIAKATNQMQTGAFLTATGTTVGTPTYMAPEQAMAQDIGPWTDLYSVGCMAFELFVGRVPFHDSEAPMAILLRHVNEPIPPVRSLNPDIDQATSDWIEALLVKDPARRTRSANDAWDAFEEIIIGRLGPRWRREARLTDRSPAAEARPLTPAPFQGTSAEPEPSSDEFESFAWRPAETPRGEAAVAPPPGPATPPPSDAPPGPLVPGPVDVPTGPPTPPGVPAATPAEAQESAAPLVGEPEGAPAAESLRAGGAAASAADPSVAEPPEARAPVAEPETRAPVAEPEARAPVVEPSRAAERPAAEPEPGADSGFVTFGAPAPPTPSDAPAAAAPEVSESPAAPDVERAAAPGIEQAPGVEGKPGVAGSVEEGAASVAAEVDEAPSAAGVPEVEVPSSSPAAPEAGAESSAPAAAGPSAVGGADAGASSSAAPEVEAPWRPAPEASSSAAPEAEDSSASAAPEADAPWPATASTFETYAAPPPPRPPEVEPSPDAPVFTPPPAEAAPAPVDEPEPVASAAPEPVAEPERAAQPAPEPAAERMAEPEPAAEPKPVRRREPAFAAASAPEMAQTVMPDALPESAAPTPRERERSGRPGWLVPVLVGLVVLIPAVIGFIAAGSGGSKEPAVETPTVAAANAGLELRAPPSWKRLGAAPRIPGVEFDDPVALAPGGRADDGSVVFGQVTQGGAGNSTLLPPAFLTAAGFGPGEVPRHKAVKLTGEGIQAYEYENLKVSGVPRKLTMFAAPTSAGVATVACSAPSADCEAIANTLRLRQGEALPVGPSKAFAAAVAQALGSVAKASATGREQLKAAKTNREQVAPARRVSSAYDRAAGSLEGLDVAPGDAEFKTQLAERLRAGQQAWKRLSTAAAAHDIGAYREAQAAVARAEKDLQVAVQGLKSAGYSVG